MARRLLLLLLLIAALGGVAYVALPLIGSGGKLGTLNARGRPPRRPEPSPPWTVSSAPDRADLRSGPCSAPPGAAPAVAENAASLTGARWSVFGRAETGWSVYGPLVVHEVGAACPPDRPGFAQALKTWQAAHGLPATGAMTADTLRAMNLVWLGRRPFVGATRGGACPAPPADELLVTARPDEGYLGKVVRLQAQATAAYRRLVAAARAEQPELQADPRLLTIISGYRSPEEQAAKCSAAGSCGTASLARCSAHRTGTAVDLFLGAAPGFAPASSDDVNRTTLSHSPAYLWLVANAARFGFVPYPFEPWHWEYTGGNEPPAPHPGPHRPPCRAGPSPDPA